EEEVELESKTTWEDLNTLADEHKEDEDGFIFKMQMIYGEEIPWETYATLHSKLLKREIKKLEIEVIKGYVVNGLIYEPPLPLNYAAQKPGQPKILGIIPRKKAHLKKGKNKILVSESSVRSAAENDSAHLNLNEKIEDAYEQYIGYLLQYELSPIVPKKKTTIKL